MTISDPIADMLIRIRNAGKAGHPEVVFPHSRLKEAIARVLQREGYLESCTVEGAVQTKVIRLQLKYLDKVFVIAGLKRISKPSCRIYCQAAAMPRVLGGLGLAIVSTPEGIITSKEAKQRKVGGEVLCYVW